MPEPQSTSHSSPQKTTNEPWPWAKVVVNFIAAGYAEDLFWSLTPRQTEAHLLAARRVARREHNARMTQAYYAAAIPNSKTPIKLKDLLVDEDDTPRQPMGWEAIKAALVIAFGAEETPEAPKE